VRMRVRNLLETAED